MMRSVFLLLFLAIALTTQSINAQAGFNFWWCRATVTDAPVYNAYFRRLPFALSTSRWYRATQESRLKNGQRYRRMYDGPDSFYYVNRRLLTCRY
jgi:hypothetical protein